MPIVQTNLPEFVESPDRQIVSAVGRLDRMTVKLTGPRSRVLAWLPKYGAEHPDYRGLMFCTDFSVSDKDGSLSEITAVYSGRVTTNGQSTFLSEKLSDFNFSEKELTYQQYFAIFATNVYSATQTINGITTPLSSISQYKCGVDNYVIRYITRDVTYKYVCNFKPTKPAFNGSETSISSQYTSRAGQGSVIYVTVSTNIVPTSDQAGIQGPFGFQQQIRCTQFTANQSIGPWYECAETWETRFEV